MYTLPNSLEEEIRDYDKFINDYRSGSLEPIKFKAIRVPLGIYEQREDETYMVRVRCVGGFMTPRQLLKVLKLAQFYEASHIHITTRQEIQIQGVTLENTKMILDELYDLGLSSRGGGGNTVRNIMASVDAGIANDEVFDVLPYAVSLTNKLIAEPDSWTLPRKFKIAFSGNNKDNANAIFNDLGFIAKINNNKKGFKVYIGGSLGSKPMVGHVLFDFIPVKEILYVADAAKKLFSRYGNRRNKHKARLRFIFYKLGKEKVFEYFHTILDEVKKTSNLDLNIEPAENKPVETNLIPEYVNSTEFITWQERYAIEQKQNGLYEVIIPINKGNLEFDKLEKLVLLIKNFGDDTIRFSMKQNIHIRNIPEKFIGNLFNLLHMEGFKTHFPFIVNSPVACTGADTCRLGICLSKGVLDRLRKELISSNLELDELKDIKINISGCPNSCGQQAAADLGFYGKVGRTDRIYPAYQIVAGARNGENSARLAELIDEISARDLPAFTIELLRQYVNKKNKYPVFSDFIDNEGMNDIKAICDQFRNIPSFEDDKNYYFDWGAENLFTVAGRGIGECSAGLFDMIDFDLNNIQELKEELYQTSGLDHSNKLLYQIIYYSSRMLLITRGIEPKDIKSVFNGFIDKFINAGLVPEKFKNLVISARDIEDVNFAKKKDEVLELAQTIIELYGSMDDSLQFKLTDLKDEKQINAEKQKSTPALKKDYRGVACPMNFVKTKIDLASLNSGDILEVLLDDGEPIDNVPGSVKNEGHKIIEQVKHGDFWSVVIEKK